METKQPDWKLVGAVGDVNPIDHGGGFIYEDTTGVYAAELEYIEPDEQYEDRYGNATRWTVYRFEIPQLKRISRTTPATSPYRDLHHEPPFTWDCLVPLNYDATWPHPSDDYDDWFNHGDMCNAQSLANFAGFTLDEWLNLFCSSDPRVRADAYLTIAQYAGLEEFDSYPLRFKDRGEIEARYEARNK